LNRAPAKRLWFFTFALYVTVTSFPARPRRLADGREPRHQGLACLPAGAPSSLTAQVAWWRPAQRQLLACAGEERRDAARAGIPGRAGRVAPGLPTTRRPQPDQEQPGR